MGIILIMSLYINGILLFIIVIINTVNSRVAVMSLDDTLAVKVGDDIIATMNKKGIELEKKSQPKNVKVKQKAPEEAQRLRSSSRDDFSRELRSESIFAVFLRLSFSGSSVYLTLFWITVGVLLRQLSLDFESRRKKDRLQHPEEEPLHLKKHPSTCVNVVKIKVQDV